MLSAFSRSIVAIDSGRLAQKTGFDLVYERDLTPFTNGYGNYDQRSAGGLTFFVQSRAACLREMTALRIVQTESCLVDIDRFTALKEIYKEKSGICDKAVGSAKGRSAPRRFGRNRLARRIVFA